MNRRPRRNHTPAFKAKVALAAIKRAHKTLRNLRWFEVVRTSGHIEGGKVEHYQVTLSVGFTMEEPA